MAQTETDKTISTDTQRQQLVPVQEIVKTLQDNPRLRFLEKTQQKQFATELFTMFDKNFTARQPEYIDNMTNLVLERAYPPLNLMEQYQKGIEDYGPMLGAMTGATYGGIRGGPMGAIAGGAIGAMGGIAAPEATRELLAPKMPSQYPTTSDLLYRMATEGVTSAVFGAGQEALMMAASRLLGPLRSKIMLGKVKIDPHIERARELLTKYGGRLTPTQLAQESNVPALTNFLENVSQWGIFSSGNFRKTHHMNTEAMLAYADDIAKKFSGNLSNEEMSLLLTDTVRQANSASTAVSSAMHGVVDTITKGGSKVATQDVLDLYRNMRQTAHGKKLAELLDLVDETGKVQPLDDYLTTIIHPPTRVTPKSALQQPFQTPGGPIPPPQAQRLGEIKFSRADRARSELLRVARLTEKSTDPLIKSAGAMATKLATKLGGAIDDAANLLPREAKAAYQNAKKFTLETKSRFNDALLLEATRAVTKDREKFIATLFSRQKLGTIKAIKEADQAIQLTRQHGGQTVLNQRAAQSGRQAFHLQPIMPEVRKAFGNELMERIISRSADGTRIGVDGKKLHALLFDPKTGLGEKMTKEVFGTEITGALRNLSSALDVAATRATGPGKITIQLMQGGIALGAATGLPYLIGGGGSTKTGVATGTIVLFGPAVISKIFNNAGFTNNLAKALMGGPKSHAFTRMLTQAAAVEPEFVDRNVPFIPSALTDAAKRANSIIGDLIRPATTTIGMPR